MGEEICACIRLKSGQTVTEEEIKAFCKGKVRASVSPRLTSPPADVTLAPRLGLCTALLRIGVALALLVHLLPGPSPPPSDLTEPNVLSLLDLQISHFKIPRYIVFVNEYPLTISGKVCEGRWGGPGARAEEPLRPRPTCGSPGSTSESFLFFPDPEIQTPRADGKAAQAVKEEAALCLPLPSPPIPGLCDLK